MATSAPISLGALFPDSDDEEQGYKEVYEVSDIEICGITLQIRQYSFHSHNANAIWPGAFAIAEYLQSRTDLILNQKVLELGAATGILSIALFKLYGLSPHTSDIADDGQVADNLLFNHQMNDVPPAKHIPHTWGEPWVDEMQFDVIIASDILLYVSAYPSLVKTLVFLFQNRGVRVFIMSWKRRIAESSQFMDLMRGEGFSIERDTADACIYTFRLEA